jgi:hypothetical protein
MFKFFFEVEYNGILLYKGQIVLNYNLSAVITP